MNSNVFKFPLELKNHPVWYYTPEVNDLDIKMSTDIIGTGRYFYPTREAVISGALFGKIKRFEITIDNLFHTSNFNLINSGVKQTDLLEDGFNGVALYDAKKRLAMLCIYVAQYGRTEIPSCDWEIVNA